MSIFKEISNGENIPPLPSNSNIDEIIQKIRDALDDKMEDDVKFNKCVKQELDKIKPVFDILLTTVSEKNEELKRLNEDCEEEKKKLRVLTGRPIGRTEFEPEHLSPTVINPEHLYSDKKDEEIQRLKDNIVKFKQQQDNAIRIINAELDKITALIQQISNEDTKKQVNLYIENILDSLGIGSVPALPIGSHSFGGNKRKTRRIIKKRKNQKRKTIKRKKNKLQKNKKSIWTKKGKIWFRKTCKKYLYKKKNKKFLRL